MKQYLKRYLAMILTFAMVITMVPTSVAYAAGEGEAAGNTTQIECSKFVRAGSIGEKTGTDNKKATLIGTDAPTTEGSEKAAARVEGETAISVNNVGSTRVAGMGFELPGKKTTDDQGGIEPELISRAELTITVYDGNDTANSGKKTKAAIFQVDSEKYAGMQDDTAVANAPGATFPAKNGYTKDKTVYGGGLGGDQGWIEYKNATQDLKVTFDVTDWVKESIANGDPYAVYRLQTVTCGYYVYIEGDQAPKLSITTLTDQEAVEQAKAELTLPASTKKNLELPAKGAYGTEITWASQNPQVIANDGTVTRQANDVDVVLAATIKKGEAQTTKDITVKVLSQDVSSLSCSI